MDLTAVAELKGSKLTDAFKANIQDVLAQKGIKVSKQAAWDIFKAIKMSEVDFTIATGKFSLSGVGSYRIHNSKPEGTKLNVFKEVPRFKYSPSDKIINHVFNTIDCFVSPEAKEEWFKKEVTATETEVSADTDNVVAVEAEVSAEVEANDDFSFDD